MVAWAPRWRLAESATVTIELTPLNDSAPPKRPVGVHVAAVMLPMLPLPDASPTVAPVPSSKPHAPTSPLDTAAPAVGSVAGPKGTTSARAIAPATVRNPGKSVQRRAPGSIDLLQKSRREAEHPAKDAGHPMRRVRFEQGTVGCSKLVGLRSGDTGTMSLATHPRLR